MSLLKRASLALACLFALSAPAVAQIQPVRAPGLTIPTQAVCFGGIGEVCVQVTMANPLPVTIAGVGGAGIATEETQQEVRDGIQALIDALAQPADGLPPPTPVASTDTTFTSFSISATASGDVALSTATSGQSSRLHDIECSILPTSGVVTVTFKSGSTPLRAIDFPAVGGVLRWTYRPYWYAKTANNEALNINFSAAGAYKCAGLVVKGA